MIRVIGGIEKSEIQGVVNCIPISNISIRLDKCNGQSNLRFIGIRDDVLSGYGVGRFQYLGYQKQTQEEEKFQAKFVVYVGFNMDKIEKAAAVDTRNTIIRIIVLFIVGSLAIVSLFLVQAYRLTRTTLSRMQAFSETLVKNMPIGLIAFDDEGKIISCNEKAREMMNGFSANISDEKEALIAGSCAPPPAGHAPGLRSPRRLRNM